MAYPFRDRGLPLPPGASSPSGTLAFALQAWVNEGGSLEPGAGVPALLPLAARERRDTVAGCRHLADGDRKEAARADTANGRLKFERSAANWEARAAGIEAGEMNDHRAADRAMWDAEE